MIARFDVYGRHNKSPTGSLVYYNAYKELEDTYNTLKEQTDYTISHLNSEVDRLTKELSAATPTQSQTSFW